MKEGASMWTQYHVRWEFLTPLMAGVPAGEDLQRKWLEARKPKTKPPSARSLDEISAEVLASTQTDETSVEDELADRLHVFQRHEGVLVVRLDTVRAHLKDCARIISSLVVGKVKGERSFAVRVTNAVYWPPETQWVPIRSAATDSPLTTASGTLERFVHSMTPQGPISAIKAFEYVEKAAIEFPLLVLRTVTGHPVVSEMDLKTLMTYGGTHGYGAERSRDGGRYAFSLSKATEE